MQASHSVSDLCRERGINLEALAQGSGLALERVQAILEGRWTPSPAERDQIAGVFGLTKGEIAWGHKSSVEHLYGHGPQFGRTP
jgi:transcriptional regulator with XRE-family HTH domain